jgi:hypothetical protein
MTDKIKVVVFVDGGTVQEIYASMPDSEIDIELVDGDNLEAEGKSDAEIEAILSEATEFLYPIW